jgi:hypothetical protein
LAIDGGEIIARRIDGFAERVPNALTFRLGGAQKPKRSIAQSHRWASGESFTTSSSALACRKSPDLYYDRWTGAGWRSTQVYSTLDPQGAAIGVGANSAKIVFYAGNIAGSDYPSLGNSVIPRR